MTQPPQDPWSNSQFGSQQFGPGQAPPVFTSGPGWAPQGRMNSLATLSLIFGFVFAPAGAVLGHLALGQIRRTGEDGRRRALIGLAVSYTVIAVTVLALVLWLALGQDKPAPAAAPAGPVSAGPSTQAATPPTDLSRLLPTKPDIVTLTGDTNIAFGGVISQPAGPDGRIGRAECWPVYSVSAKLDNAEPSAGYLANEFSDQQDMSKPFRAAQAVMSFADAPTAQTHLAKLREVWQKCAGDTLNITAPGGGGTFAVTVGSPVDAGNGITTVELTTAGTPLRAVRSIAVKNNVVVNALVQSIGDANAQALAVTNLILGRIPG